MTPVMLNVTPVILRMTAVMLRMTPVTFRITAVTVSPSAPLPPEQTLIRRAFARCKALFPSYEGYGETPSRKQRRAAAARPRLQGALLSFHHGRGAAPGISS